MRAVSPTVLRNRSEIGCHASDVGGERETAGMARYVIDAPVALRLVAPNSLRSEAMSILYREVRAGIRSRDDARALLDPLTALKVRLLGDRVSRGTAWRIAEELGWDDIHDAEYLAVTRLQADAFVTLDPERARRAEGVVPVAWFEALAQA
jgi:predicted nucleic acid-binding protein